MDACPIGRRATTPARCKYNEDKYLQELQEYIIGTYSQHYSQNRLQATEFIIDAGHGTGFCIGNILKYAQRYGKKGTRSEARKDIMKVLHYAIMQLHIHDTGGGALEEAGAERSF